MTIAILIILLLVIGYVVMTYNKLVAQIEAIRNNQKQIESVMKRMGIKQDNVDADEVIIRQNN